MKTFVIAVTVAAMAGAAAPAFAQTLTAPQGYAGVGYTGLSPDGHDIGELTGRMGLKFNPYWGVEAEVGTGVSDHHFTNNAGSQVSVSEQPSAAGYIVGYYPVTPKFDLLARVGYGDTAPKYATPTGNTFNASMNVNYGAGAQYFLDGKNGIRVDYTRRDYQGSATAPKDMDTWAVGYVHRF